MANPPRPCISAWVRSLDAVRLTLPLASTGDNHTIVVLEDFCGDEIVWYTLLVVNGQKVYFCISKFCIFICDPAYVTVRRSCEPSLKL